MQPERMQPETAESPQAPPPGATRPRPWSRIGHSELLLPTFLALALSGALFLLQARLDYNIAEEGFQWYGAIHTAHGQVPLRDFYAYDPGRYYWAAAWAPLLGDGIVALRLSTAAFQALGLFCGLLAARRVVASRWLLAAVGLVLLLWMVPRNKVFEPAIAMAAVWCAVLLIEKPSLRRHFWAGALTGAAAFFGKNLGLYLLCAFALLIPFVHFRLDRGARRSRPRADVPADAGEPGPDPSGSPAVEWLPRPFGRKLLAWGLGIAAGSLPLLLMLGFVPGFYRSYVDSLLYFVELGQTNFPLPVPWPWRVAGVAGALAGRAPIGAAGQPLAVGLCFLLLPAFYAVAAATAVATSRATAGRRALLLACGFVGVFYLHHALARADFHHLAQSFHPLLLGLLALPSALSRGRPEGRHEAAVAAIAAVLLAVTALTAWRESPLCQEVAAAGTGDPFVAYRLGADELRLLGRKARFLNSCERVIAAHVPAGEPLLIAPNLPGLYPVLGRTSPVWDIYPIWPARGARDRRMLGELEQAGVKWALVLPGFRMDGRDELSFANSYPEVFRYLMREFERLPAPRLAAGWWLMKKRAGGSS
jgi:hypothetical protein